MPRKQRFKPSRKPKPIPQAEEAMIGQPTVSNSANNDNVESQALPRDREEGSRGESESEQRSR
jgi:hypothetical protein